MKKTRKKKNLRARLAIVSASACAVHAGEPQGMIVSQGNVTAVQNGANLSITASHNAVINWQSFNIGAGETTTFQQPNANSVVWNRINDANPSQIWGTLNANGIVVLMNQNGFYFGPNSVVNVGGFVATTATVVPPPDTVGGIWSYSGPPPQAKIENYGAISVAKGGSLFLISDKVENHGSLNAPEGTVALYAGKKVLLSERPDGRGLSATVQLPEGSVDNAGRIVAPGGEIALHAEVVNQSGLLQADSVQTHNGVIELVASKSIDLAASSLIQANGDSSAPSAGGVITIKSSGSFQDANGSRIEARGGEQGGDGGSIELSATKISGVSSTINASAQNGYRGGNLLFDPYDIVLSSSSGDISASEFTKFDDSPNEIGDLLTLDVTKAFVGFANIRLQASHDITLAENTSWNLALTTGISGGGSLSLEAGHDIIFQDKSHLVASGSWSISLLAGADFTSPTPAAIRGTGGIYLNGSSSAGAVATALTGSIETAAGDIRLEAGHEIAIGKGFVHTTDGGNISIKTGDGDVQAGSNANAYQYSNLGATIGADGLGGIGTQKGGNVSINSGHDILSFVPFIGAFGDKLANVDLTAANDIKGRFMLRNGTGTIHAGGNVGDADTASTLGLVTGGWNVHADHTVFLNEVFNPNGSLNDVRVKGQSVKFQFNYAQDAYAKIDGDDSVHLVGSGVLHTANNPTRPAIYPPILEVKAGAGGVVIANDLVLYPSALGSLKITTTDAGALESAPGKFAQLSVSDSASLDYNTFASGHASAPLHENGPKDGIFLDISGDLKNLFLRAPMAATIKVGGDAVNFAFEGQNLSSKDTTHLLITGDYFSRSDRTFEETTVAPDLSTIADPNLAINPELGRRFTYDATTHQLGVQGILTPEELAFLKAPTKYLADPATQLPLLGPDGFPTVVPAVFTTDFGALERLADRSQDIPTSGTAFGGMQLGGPGAFEITARNMDLGISQGIRSIGPAKNSALAKISVDGVNLGITLQGDLKMTSSQIASFNGGNIDLSAKGKMDVGSQISFTSDEAPKGVYTAHGGDVSVKAAGDISINGSRIATYDGGNISVVSEQGNVDAGAGAKGFFYVTTSQLNGDGVLESRNDKFFGSGIMTATRPDGDAKIGDITVTAAKDISANSGGIVQIPFNSRDQSDANITLKAGGDIVANQSGILGRNVSLDAKNVSGLVVASGNVNIQAQQNVSVTALAGGSANVSGGGTISGSVVGGGSVNVAGSEVSAAVISTGGNANTTGESSSATVGAFTSVAATGAQKTVETADKTVAAQATTLDEEEEKKKRLPVKSPVLQRRVGRVTVILPKT